MSKIISGMPNTQAVMLRSGTAFASRVGGAYRIRPSARELIVLNPSLSNLAADWDITCAGTTRGNGFVRTDGYSSGTCALLRQDTTVPLVEGDKLLLRVVTSEFSATSGSISCLIGGTLQTSITEAGTLVYEFTLGPPTISRIQLNLAGTPNNLTAQIDYCALFRK